MHVFLSGTLDTVIAECSKHDPVINSKVVHDNHTQLRTAAGVVLNWHPKQKKLAFQGKEELCRHLFERIETLEKSSPEGAEQAAVAQSEADGYSYKKIENPEEAYRSNNDSELVIGLVAPTGTDLTVITTILSDRLKSFGYDAKEIKISSDIISKLRPIPTSPYFDRTHTLMTEGNNLRRDSGDNSILAKAAAARINLMRAISEDQKTLLPMRRRAFIVSSLKHPDEVVALRKIYSNGFFLIGVHGGSEETRLA